MMRLLAPMCAMMGFLALGLAVEASPLKGGYALQAKVPGGQDKQLFEDTFKAGERACVIVIGDHNPPVPLHLKVLDAKGNLIGEDKSVGDYCAVIWYPPRDGVYVVSVAVPNISGDANYNILYIAVK